MATTLHLPSWTNWSCTLPRTSWPCQTSRYISKLVPEDHGFLHNDDFFIYPSVNKKWFICFVVWMYGYTSNRFLLNDDFLYVLVSTKNDWFVLLCECMVIAQVPLILGIWGGKGQGKSYQCELVFSKLGIKWVKIFCSANFSNCFLFNTRKHKKPTWKHCMWCTSFPTFLWHIQNI